MAALEVVEAVGKDDDALAEIRFQYAFIRDLDFVRSDEAEIKYVETSVAGQDDVDDLWMAGFGVAELTTSR